MLVTLAAAAIGFGSFMTGTELLQACEAKASACYEYIAGAADLANFNEVSEGLPPTLCLKVGVEREQVREAVLAWLYGHPKLRRGPAAPQVKLALQQAMPCSPLDAAEILRGR